MTRLAELYGRSQIIEAASIFAWPSAEHDMARSLDRPTVRF
jgi:hypothetical protein